MSHWNAPILPPGFATGSAPAISPKEFNAIREIVKREAGIALSDGKTALVVARLAPRLRKLGLTSFGEYYDRVCSDPSGVELRVLINAITTNKTEFFRESQHFEFLRRRVVPEIEARASKGAPPRIRIWSSACSTGEEPYTIAMVLFEAAKAGWSIEILATDIDTDVLAKAQAAVYSEAQLTDVPAYMLKRYFLRGTGQNASAYKIRPEIAQLVRFQQLNLNGPSWNLPCRDFDAIFCRNVIIYFDMPTKQRLFERFSEVLSPSGYMLIGHSETLQGVSTLFSRLEGTVYRLSRAGPGHSRDVVGPLVTTGRTSFIPSDGVSSSQRLTPSDEKRTPSASSPLVAVRPVARSHEPPRRASSDRSLPPADLTAKPATRQAIPVAPAPAAREPQRANIPPIPRLPTERISIGGVYASANPSLVQTLLGSCVSACLFDPQTQVGGMNHFLLPDAVNAEIDATRYGVHAMEVLINQIMKMGGNRRRLQAKIFGGGEMLQFSTDCLKVAQQNVAFVRSFLADEGITIVSESVGGRVAREVTYLTSEGKAWVRVMDQGPVDLAAAESEHERQVRAALRDGKSRVYLFGM